ncbi:MAG: CapA family protein [Eubacterium sp.]|nr:CapA family protein [Eubacterium sp.]
MAKKDFKNYLPVLIPLIAAVVVVSTLAISGKVTSKIAENREPTISQDSVTEQVTEKSKDAKVTLVAVGDNLIHNTLIASGEQQDGTYNYDDLYDEAKHYIEPADIAIIDQETVLGGKDFPYTGYPMFNSPWEIGEASINAGFDVFTCANNHILDMGSKGIENEKAFFAKHPEVTAVGTNLSEEDKNKITYIEKNGIKFALLNYTDSTNGIPIPEDKPYLVNMLEKERVTKDIKTARQNADVVMVIPHWGTENSHDINEEQKEYVKLFSDLGVDIVIGCHPHVLQPVEWVTNAETGKKMIVYYSLGNFISHQINLYQMCGGMAEITVERKNGEIEITNAKLAPLVDFYTYSGTKYEFDVYKLSEYNDDLAAKQAQQGATVDYFTKLAKDVISEEFLDMS